jgi:hypothetical protein
MMQATKQELEHITKMLSSVDPTHPNQNLTEALLLVRNQIMALYDVERMLDKERIRRN